ncbi:glycosyltransferase family 2 protein [Empedobacter falsenii]|uniref:glycosyltransferase family 2 protein n=1 Tax=Empedobacter falsenii TaxID=343874 RepID=UPI003A80FCFD
MIELSIIIPVYNVEKYIENCLKSIYNQKSNYIKFEVICVNDGSPDQSVQVIENFIQKNNIQNLLLLSQENRGASAARNLGIDKAKGKYIWFIDSDDFIEANAFSIIQKHWDSNHADYLLKFNYNIVNNGIITQSKIFNSNKDFILYNSYDFILTHKPSFMVLVIYRRDIMNINNLRFIDGIKNIEDLEFNTRYFYYYNKVKHINVSLYNYVDNNNSTSRNLSIDNLKKLAEDSFIVHKSLKKWYDVVEESHDKVIVSDILNHSVMGFFYSLIYKNYPKEYFIKYYNLYKNGGLLPIKRFKRINIQQSLFVRLVNSSFFLQFIHLFKFIKSK